MAANERVWPLIGGIPDPDPLAGPAAAVGSGVGGVLTDRRCTGIGSIRRPAPPVLSGVATTGGSSVTVRRRTSTLTGFSTASPNAEATFRWATAGASLRRLPGG